MVFHTKKMFTNFKLADWKKFTRFVVARVVMLRPPTNAHIGEKHFRRILKDAEHRFIPHGRHHETVPFVPSKIRILMKRRDRVRAADHQSREVSNLNRRISSELAKHSKAMWSERLDRCSTSRNPISFWRLVRSLRGRDGKPRDTAIKFGDKVLSDPRHIAQAFNRQYATVVRHHLTKERKKATWKLVHQKPLGQCPAFTGEEIALVIKGMKNSRAEGPDRLTICHYKHLGRVALGYLAHIFNRALENCQIPAIWKRSHVIPLPKPGKDATLGDSYRPVSLLCPGSKILEKLILPALREHLHLASHQHGFRKYHSTTSALLKIVAEGSANFNRPLPNPNRTIVVAIDISKAFDSLDHCTLLQRVADSTIPGYLLRFVQNWLHGREMRTLFRDNISKTRKIKCGAPQGSAISPDLFNFHIAGIPQPDLPIHVVSYADDLTIFGTGPPEEIIQKINDYLAVLFDYLRSIFLNISPAKSTASMLTRETRQINRLKSPNQMELRIFIDGIQVPTVLHPKILGVTFDPQLLFHQHVSDVNRRVRRNTNAMKMLASTSFGQSKESLITTYKAIGRSLCDYAAPVWSPSTSDSSWRKLQATQNGALRVALGCHRAASEDHLHAEANMLKVQEHCDMLSCQYLSACFAPYHPCHELSLGHLGRLRRNGQFRSLLLRHHEWVAARLVFDPGGEVEVVRSRKAIHSEFVRSSLASRGNNRVLGAVPPRVHPRERQLKRDERCLLSQLRSGHCIKLRNFKHMLDANVPNSCPWCEESPHDTGHLFNCNHRKTTLGVTDLWNKPVQAARFLRAHFG
jgi:hypothetical protein